MYSYQKIQNFNKFFRSEGFLIGLNIYRKRLKSKCFFDFGTKYNLKGVIKNFVLWKKVKQNQLFFNSLVLKCNEQVKASNLKFPTRRLNSFLFSEAYINHYEVFVKNFSYKFFFRKAFMEMEVFFEWPLLISEWDSVWYINFIRLIYKFYIIKLNHLFLKINHLFLKINDLILSDFILYKIKSDKYNFINLLQKKLYLSFNFKNLLQKRPFIRNWTLKGVPFFIKFYEKKLNKKKSKKFFDFKSRILKKLKRSFFNKIKMFKEKTFHFKLRLLFSEYNLNLKPYFSLMKINFHFKLKTLNKVATPKIFFWVSDFYLNKKNILTLFNKFFFLFLILYKKNCLNLIKNLALIEQLFLKLKYSFYFLIKNRKYI